ncbi:MAG TPA: YetF domain-containing protein, partial [Xanthomonadaceae bacterium]|nr:YetF domain-containing protein [Xanthomonadaceae bacterium]
ETVLRAVAIYLFLLLVFRISGKRSLAQMNAFDLVLVLIIGESASQGLTGDDFSITTTFVLVTTLILMEKGFALLKQNSRPAEHWLDDLPTVLVENGKPLKDKMKQQEVNEEDVMEAARNSQGLETMDQVKYAVLERGGTISVIPMKQ